MGGYKSISGLASAALVVAMAGMSPADARADQHAASVDTITVVAPRVTVERGAPGVSKVVTAEMSARVNASDLDLGRIADMRELEARVSEAAAMLCRDLEAELPFGQPSRVACQRRAFDDAMAQVRDTTQLAMVR